MATLCVHIIVGDPANVTHIFPTTRTERERREKRDSGATEGRDGRGGGDRENAGSSSG